MLRGFAEYWEESPPVNELVAAWLEVRGKGSGGESAGDPGELLQMFPKAG